VATVLVVLAVAVQPQEEMERLILAQVAVQEHTLVYWEQGQVVLALSSFATNINRRLKWLTTQN
jgi:hypothetical protein